MKFSTYWGCKRLQVSVFLQTLVSVQVRKPFETACIMVNDTKIHLNKKNERSSVRILKIFPRLGLFKDSLEAWQITVFTRSKTTLTTIPFGAAATSDTLTFCKWIRSNLSTSDNYPANLLWQDLSGLNYEPYIRAENDPVQTRRLSGRMLRCRARGECNTISRYWVSTAIKHVRWWELKSSPHSFFTSHYGDRKRQRQSVWEKTEWGGMVEWTHVSSCTHACSPVELWVFEAITAGSLRRSVTTARFPTEPMRRNQNHHCHKRSEDPLVDKP